MKNLLIFFLNLIIVLGICSFSVYAAPEWPANTMIDAESGIVMDAGTNAVIYGTRIHERYHPASITKILTALIVIEQCDMDDIVTYSHNAVYNVEAGSSNANLEKGDQLTVRDSLYAMMLKSANESANALAEHVSGSTEEFAKLMNAKAVELGCQNSNFRNPSGLNDEEHYTTAYDMALISTAAFNNDSFVEIASSLYYDLPATIREPEGFRIYPKHKMIKKNLPEYYPGAIGGKTGYTTIARNTLVTCAEKNGLKLVTVVLGSDQTHYSDTKILLNFGFNNFTSLRISDYETNYTNIENDLTIGNLPAADLSVLTFTKDSTIILPNSAVFTDADSSITYDLTPTDPANAVAKVQYMYLGRNIGSGYLIRGEKISVSNQSAVSIINMNEELLPQPSSPDIITARQTTEAGTEEANRDTSSTTAAAPIDTAPFEVPPVFFAVLAGILILAGLIAALIMWLKHSRRKEEEDRRMRYERRQQRLREMGVSPADFEKMVQNKRNGNEL